MRPDELSRLGRLVPGSGPVEIQRLGTGLVNESYRITRDGRRYALRIAARRVAELGLDRNWETRVLASAAQAGLAPLVEYSDPDGGILILGWTEGRAWSAPEAVLDENMARIAALVRRVQGLKPAPPLRKVTPRDWIEHYAAAAAVATAAEVVRDAAEYSQGAAHRLRSDAEQHLQALAQLPRFDPVLCHGDLHLFNLIAQAESLVLIDWEYAHASDPFWDLAGWVANNDLDESSRSVLLFAYLGGPPTREDWTRLGLLIWLYDYICLGWSELYLSLRRKDLASAAGAPAGSGSAAGADVAGAAALSTDAAATDATSADAGIAARASVLEIRLSRPGSRAGQDPAHYPP